MGGRKVCVAVLAAAVVALAVITSIQAEAIECDIDLCGNSTCRCSSTDIPGDLDLSQMPQFVILSFDEAVTVSNFELYKEISQYQNPNGCNISMTLFVSHENTDYTKVNELHRWGHEISTHSVSSLAAVETYWRNMTEEAWGYEMNDMRSMLAKYGKIPEEDITGFRVPFLEVGGNLMYKVLHDSGFEYDSSWPTLRYTPWSPTPQDALGTLWPYTLDYRSIQEQTVGTPPTDSFPGLWLSPMTDMQDNRGEPCPMLDLCLSEGNELETSEDAVFDLLRRNFKMHLDYDRAPFGLYTRQAWFANDQLTNSTARTNGFKMFMEYLEAYPEVYVVTVQQLLQWIQDPTTLDDIADFEPFQCEPDRPPSNCLEADQVNCHYDTNLPINQTEIYMKICEKPCPEVYPWTGNPDGIETLTERPSDNSH